MSCCAGIHCTGAQGLRWPLPGEGRCFRAEASHTVVCIQCELCSVSCCLNATTCVLLVRILVMLFVVCIHMTCVFLKFFKFSSAHPN